MEMSITVLDRCIWSRCPAAGRLFLEVRVCVLHASARAVGQLAAWAMRLLQGPIKGSVRLVCTGAQQIH
jgi:hypothetical protein